MGSPPPGPPCGGPAGTPPPAPCLPPLRGLRAGHLRSASRPSAPPGWPALVAVRPSGLRPAPRPVGPWCASPPGPPAPLALACRRLRSPVARVRAAPRRLLRSLVGAASARSARGLPRASLRSVRALVLCRALPFRVPPRGPPPPAAASPSLLRAGGFAGLPPRSPAPSAATDATPSDVFPAP